MRKTDHTKGKHGNAFKPKKTQRGSSNNQTLRFQSKDFSKGERKNCDTNNIGLICPAGGAFRASPIHLNSIARSDSATGRIGRKLTMKSLQFRFTVNESSGSGPSQVRFVVVYDKQSNLSTPAVTDVFTIDRFDSPINLNNSDRFVVVCDEVSESRQSTSLNISGQRYVKMNLDAIFTGSGGAPTDINTGALWLFLAANGAVGDTETTPVDSFFRLRYVDA